MTEGEVRALPLENGKGNRDSRCLAGILAQTELSAAENPFSGYRQAVAAAEAVHRDIACVGVWWPPRGRPAVHSLDP